MHQLGKNKRLDSIKMHGETVKIKEEEEEDVCFLLGYSPASEFRRRGITQMKAYNI